MTLFRTSVQWSQVTLDTWTWTLLFLLCLHTNRTISTVYFHYDHVLPREFRNKLPGFTVGPNSLIRIRIPVTAVMKLVLTLWRITFNIRHDGILAWGVTFINGKNSSQISYPIAFPNRWLNSLLTPESTFRFSSWTERIIGRFWRKRWPFRLRLVICFILNSTATKL